MDFLKQHLVESFLGILKNVMEMNRKLKYQIFLNILRVNNLLKGESHAEGRR